MLPEAAVAPESFLNQLSSAQVPHSDINHPTAPMAAKKLFTPVTLGGKKDPLTLAHRIVMCPLTRLKASVDGGVQPDFVTKYYSQRATEGGLIVSEATDISPTAHGSACAPGIYSDEQIESWKPVTSAVHAKGGKMFLQLWHTGRMSHPLNQPNGQLPVSSSSKMDPSLGMPTATPKGRIPAVNPRALETHEIPQIVQDYKTAAKNALIAGFDGVEIHSATGYLLEQFLHDGVNDRTDKYGGSIENRARFLFEALEAILEEVNSNRVGIRLSPFASNFGQFDSTPVETYSYVLKKLNDYDLAYVHLIEPYSFPMLAENPSAPKDGIAKIFRPIYNGTIISAAGYNRAKAIQVVEDGHADLVAFGRYFIANPDLVKRLTLDAPLHEPVMQTFYAPGETGYTDQPFLEEEHPDFVAN